MQGWRKNGTVYFKRISKKKIRRNLHFNKHFWLDCFESLKSRGLKNILFLSVDDNKNMKRTAKIAFPEIVFVDSLTDKEGEFVFGPLCPDKEYAIQIWVNDTKKIKICTKGHHEGKCLKGEKNDLRLLD